MGVVWVPMGVFVYVRVRVRVGVRGCVCIRGGRVSMLVRVHLSMMDECGHVCM